MNNSLCADCGAETLQSCSEIEQFDYKGHALKVIVEYSLCSQCGTEVILPDQIKCNDRRTRDAWRQADGLLSGTEIVALRKQLGLTQQQASQMFGGGANAFSKYERGEVVQSVAMDNLMRLALEIQPVEVVQWLINHAGLVINKPAAGYDKVIPFRTKPKRDKVPSAPSSVSIDNLQEANYG